MILLIFIVIFFVNNVEKNLTFTFLCVIIVIDNKDSLEKNMINYLNLHNSKISVSNKIKNNFIKEKIAIKDIDYYYSNAIARASKVMSECKNEKIKLNSTGTEG